MTEIELLAPAKNLTSGKAAINYGADAVYIGADRFGARAAASNSVADIAQLVQYAHRYRAKVFVTLNTLLYDNELEAAEQLIHQLYQAGADALIIQDMGILQMNLPPIALHASTQTNNFSPDRIAFLDQLGFERIILARELSLDEIHNIRKQTTAGLEFFIHGALCVSLSGQCYFSQVLTGRSANRGMCAQMCRHPYNLVDGKGNRVILNSHLLSLKDLNLSHQLLDLMKAGITSLKIEGRLKDLNYIKNVVSYYRRKLDDIFAADAGFSKASSGNTQISFDPDPEKSFNRLSSTYFLNGRQNELINPASPKSMGQEIGVVGQVGSGFFTLTGTSALHNGDGLCFVKDGELIGLRVEKLSDHRVLVNDTTHLAPGMKLYRNYDHIFTKQLEADQSIRKVGASIGLMEEGNALLFSLTDEDQLTSVYRLEPLPEKAKDAAMAEKNLIAQLSKSGNAMFDVSEVNIHCKSAYFFRISSLNDIRRVLFQQHEQLRIKHFTAKEVQHKQAKSLYPKKAVDFSENIANHKAAQFYTEHGVEKQEKALEIGEIAADQLLMTTRYCLKYELGFCPKWQDQKNAPPEPLYLEDHNRKYRLQFDCKRCLMMVRKEQ